MRRIEAALLAADSSREAVVDGRISLTYAALLARAKACATLLREQGLRPGDRVAIVLEKTSAAVCALYGTWLAAGVVATMVSIPLLALALRLTHVFEMLSQSSGRV